MVLFLTESKLPGISADTARDRRLFLLREIGCCVGLAFGEVVRMEGRPTLLNRLPTASNRWAIYYQTNPQPRIDRSQAFVEYSAARLIVPRLMVQPAFSFNF